jgi:endonuclease/exonuclease/phosphatase family metal-dependent hydrolase
MKLKVLSYNIHKGYNLGNRLFVLRDIKKALRDTGADILFLQEVKGSHEEFTENEEGIIGDQFEYLADTVWTNYAYGKNAIYPKGHHGNAILSKYPIVYWHNLDLSLTKMEYRGLLHAEILIPGEKAHLHLLNTHINLLKHHRTIQIEKILGYISENIPSTDRIIFGGDFNDWAKNISPFIFKNSKLSEVFLTLNGNHPKTFPSMIPLLSLDRIYYQNIKPLKASTLKSSSWKKLSDHIPLMAEFEI